ncbi:envelope glycoprotein M UL10 [Leporid alphaherpesvirus 4]|uniref:Envelope glycoprotein M UL10 n=1 Tax=Leporid alphaherpesvirus 4 TaxID=481315 RepID=J9QQR9_9ALPH|nr:envelope glycoprotein M UL10 [Leporid alphaherpesvirus 4]AFR32451.1 envelope glycoprotein M UL10 [Leporid alphaherpesvirus 4]
MAHKGEQDLARVTWRIWCVQATAFALSSLCLVGLLIVAYFFDAGFPCFYAMATARVGGNHTNHAMVRGGVAVELGLGTRSLVGTYVTTAVTLVAVAVYVIAGAATSRYRNGIETQARLDAVYMVAPHTTLVFGTVCPWLLQITVILLAYRATGLAHVIYVLHFLCFSCFAFHFGTRGVFSGTYVKQVHAMIDAAPSHHRVVGPVRAVVLNLLLMVVLVAAAAVATSTNAIVAINFNPSAPGMLVTTVCMFAAVVLCFILVVEFLISHYVQVLVGPHIGAIAAAGMVGVAVEHYYKSSYYVAETQWSGAHGGVRAALILVAVFVIIMAAVRLVRAYLHHREYRTAFFRRVRATKSRAKTALRKVRGSMQSAGRRSSSAPLYPGAANASGDEPIYEDVASDGEEIYSRRASRDDPIYDSVSEW